MPRRRVTPSGLAQAALRSLMPHRNVCAKAVPLQSFSIDEYAASPWIGLHYRHEFLLHYRHELLEQQDLTGRSDKRCVESGRFS